MLRHSRPRRRLGSTRPDTATDGAFAAVLDPAGGLLVAGRRPGGGVLLGRLRGGPAAAAAAAARPRLVTLAARYAGRGYAYGLVDGGCATVKVRFVVKPKTGRSISTRLQAVFARFGPQVVCAPLKGLRTGARYPLRIAAAGGAPRGEQRVLRVSAASRRALPQEGCR